MKKWKMGLLGAAFAGVLSLGMSFGVKAADGVDIETTFPDEAFRTYISENIDTSKDGNLSDEEIDDVWKIDVSSMGINSLEGIETFYKLRVLVCGDNGLTKLDVSRLKGLSGLFCWENYLTELDVSANADLVDLNCEDNKIQSLDVSKNSYLMLLICNNNKLQELDVHSNAYLSSLQCSGNSITGLDLSDNPDMLSIECRDNALKKLTIGKSATLRELDCSGNALTGLNVTKCPELEFLDCSENKLKTLNVSNNTKLQKLDCHSNQISAVCIAESPDLVTARSKGARTKKNDVISYSYKDTTRVDGETLVYSVCADFTATVRKTHSWNAGTVLKKATCMKKGVKKCTCTTCGHTAKLAIKAKGHKVVKDKAVAATFTKKGKTAGSHCSVCKAVIKKQKAVPMKTGLRKIKGKTYFYRNGKKQAGWQKVGKKKYYFNKKTKVMKTGWLKIGKKYYYFSPKKKTLGQMVTGKLKIGKKTYRFNANGVCLNP